MKISYQITKEDFLEAQKLHCSKSPAGWIRVSRLIVRSLALILFVTLLGWALVGKDPTVWPNLRPLFLLGSFWALFFWVWKPFNWRRAYARDRRFQHEIAADISETGIHFESANADSIVKWGLFIRFLESDRIFILYQSKQLFNMFPKRAFAPGEGDQFRDLLHKNLSPK